MKFKLNKQPSAAVSVPLTALKLAQMDGSPVSAHVDVGAVILLNNAMTASDTIAAIETLTELSDGLMAALLHACEDYLEGDCPDEDCVCETCDHPDCCGIELPPCLMDEAGFPVGTGLEAFVEDCRIIVTPTTVLDEDFAEELPEPLLHFFTESKMDIGVLRALAEHGDEVVYGG